MRPAAVRIDLHAGALVIADGRTVVLGRADLAFYTWLARRQRAGQPPVRIPAQKHRNWISAQRAEYQGYLAEYEAVAEVAGVSDNTGAELRAEGAMTYRFFHDRKTGIADTLEEALGPLADAYAIRALTDSRPYGYGLAIPAEAISISGGDL